MMTETLGIQPVMTLTAGSDQVKQWRQSSKTIIAMMRGYRRIYAAAFANTAGSFNDQQRNCSPLGAPQEFSIGLFIGLDLQLCLHRDTLIFSFLRATKQNFYRPID